MTFTLNLITRNRPEFLLKTVKHTVGNLSRDDTCYMISVDDDDVATLEVVTELKHVDPRIFVNIKPREDAIGDKWSRALEVPASLYGIQGDYRPFLTPGFDQKMLDAAFVFPDGIGGVYTHMDNASFASTIAMTHGLVQKLGYMFPSIYPYWFVDHAIKDILELIDRISFADVELGYISQKPATQEQREVVFWATLFDCQRIQRRREALAIIESPDFQEPEWRKNLLRRHYPLIEYKSQCINDLVRAIFEKDTQPPPHGGERYVRVKQRALAEMGRLAPEMIAEMGRAA